MAALSFYLTPSPDARSAALPPSKFPPPSSCFDDEDEDDMESSSDSDDDAASVNTLNVDQVLLPDESNKLVRMSIVPLDLHPRDLDSLSHSSGSDYGEDDGEDADEDFAWDGGEYPDADLAAFEWSPLNIADCPVSSGSVGWDSTDETHYSRSAGSCLSRTASVDGSSYQKQKNHWASSTPGTGKPRISYRTSPYGESNEVDEVVMLKRTDTLSEVPVVEYLNAKELRRDPWNPAAPLLSIFNSEHGDDEAVLVLDKLSEVDSQPFRIVLHALDYVKQMLQGLVFLHTEGIAHQGIRPEAVMMETGDAPVDQPWDRSQYDVRYYLVDFSTAMWVQKENLDAAFALDLAQSADTIQQLFGQSMPELSPLLQRMTATNQSCTAEEALETLSRITRNLSGDRLIASLA